ncbi:MAG TPA: extracellular solute-binding protein [Candidatus Obscuribacterales bacterium]
MPTHPSKRSVGFSRPGGYSRRRFGQWVMLSAGVTSLLANCRPSEVPAPSNGAEERSPVDWQRYRGQTLRLLLDQHPWTEGIQPYLADFEALTGIRLERQIVPEPDYFQVLEAALRQDPVPHDVCFLPMDSTAYRLWQEALLLPLTPLLNDSQLTEASYNLFDFPEGFRLAATYPPAGDKQHLFGIPATFDAYVLFYNKRLINQYLDGVVPKTMPDLIAAAQHINQVGRGEFFGAVMRGVKADTIIDTVTGVVLNSWGAAPTPLPYNLWFDGDWQRPRFTDPAIVAGLTAYARLMQAGPPQIKAMDWPEATALFRAGKAAFYIDASLFGPNYQEPTAAIAPDVGYGVLPPVHQDSLTGHWLWGLGIAQKTPQPEAAWLFVQWATSQRMEPLIAVMTGGAPRFSSWLRPSAYTKAMAIDYALTVQTAMQTSRPTVVLHARWPAVAVAIATAIQNIYDGVDPTLAVDQLQAAVVQIMAQEAA